MTPADQINTHILDTTLEIKDTFPELSKYIEEMPVTIPADKDPQIGEASLNEYENSLLELVNKYATSHTGKKDKAV